MRVYPLEDGWTLQAQGNVDEAPAAVRDVSVPATVPGCVHTDLIAAGLLEDPCYGLAELEQMWVGQTDWLYTCRFDVSEDLLAHDRLDLACDGLDTIATLRLNGKEIGRGESQHITYRFDVRSALQPGENVLEIEFASPVKYARSMSKAMGEHPHSLDLEPFNFIRKTACNFGWDWGPKTTTSGIWRPIRLEAWDHARIASVRPLVTRAEADIAEVEVHVEIEWATEASLPLRAALSFEGKDAACRQMDIAPGQTEATLRLGVADPKRWWPRGYGEQPLYNLNVTLGEGLGEQTSRLGLRTVNFNTDTDEIGEKFVIEINGQPVFCKGANWIPDDIFFTRVDAARYRERIEQAVAANMNMLRVWGGGLYESDEFYDICDELGVMVWQDFLFACAMYAEEEPFGSLVETEARQNVTRLSSHASLVLWNGCNENLWGYLDWGNETGGVTWKDAVEGKTWGAGFYYDLLPRVVKELDPSRPYWPGSPYSGSPERHPQDDRYGNRHVWDPWFKADYACYRESRPRFSSEFGFQGAMNYAQLQKYVSAEPLEAGCEALAHRQRSPDGDNHNQKRLLDYFEIPEGFDDWHFLLQLNQARALTLGVEWFRYLQPRCMGALYWQLNDCWPATSWSALDYLGKPRPMYYATKRFFADHLLTIQPADGKDDVLHVIANNDTNEPWRETITIRRLRFDGPVLAEMTVETTVPPRGCAVVAELQGDMPAPNTPTEEMIVAMVGQAGPGNADRAIWYFDVDKELVYPTPTCSCRLEKTAPGRYALTVEAEMMLRDLAVFVDRVDPDATISDQLITLLPGESFTFEITSQQELTAEALTQPPVFQCANRFGRKTL